MKTTTESTMKMHNPLHPGEVLRELCLEPLGLSVTQAAQALGVSRKTLSSILNGRSGISPEMAVRLSIAFNTTAESWLRQQLLLSATPATASPSFLTPACASHADRSVPGISNRGPGSYTGIKAFPIGMGS